MNRFILFTIIAVQAIVISKFSNRELIVIFAAAGSAVFIAVCASICTYWKLKTGFRAVNNPVAENDNATVQHNDIDANILQMPLQENTYVHYHEISEVSTVDINLAVDNKNIEIDIADIHVRDGNLSTSTMKLGTINQLLHMTENDPSTSWAGKPLQKDPPPIVFMALAEMTISDVDVTVSNILRADVEGACYENLDPERRVDKCQYNSLV
ncbi:uncharacterized protein LOC127863004 isoform X2 [Dreissena polymorpha]|uniref:uncharacterized protein LOC127863004 isoform X2 n=1 Tax=Dreissena polymorpha TaxID=45954 RepID=UPI002264534F|nr:uncharacterized protein LOC127863004 isoform X2 [Dreissena polymorpha]